MEGDELGQLGMAAAKGAGSGASFGLVGAGIGAGLGLLQSAYGISQMHKAKKLAGQNQRPTYNIPDEISQNLSDAQRMSLEGLPDEQKQQFVNNIQRSQQFGLNASADRKGGLAGLGNIVQAGNDSYNNLLGQDAAARQRNQQLLMQQRGVMADYKDKAFQLNQMEPYQQKAAAIRAMTGAGTQNLWGGLGAIGQVGAREGTGWGFGGGGGAQPLGEGGGFQMDNSTMQPLKNPWG